MAKLNEGDRLYLSHKLADTTVVFTKNSKLNLVDYDIDGDSQSVMSLNTKLFDDQLNKELGHFLKLKNSKNNKQQP
jgi:hypothetical protein